MKFDHSDCVDEMNVWFKNKIESIVICLTLSTLCAAFVTCFVNKHCCFVSLLLMFSSVCIVPFFFGRVDRANQYFFFFSYVHAYLCIKSNVALPFRWTLCLDSMTVIESDLSRSICVCG